MLSQALFPISDRGGRNGETCRNHLPEAAAASARAGPRKKCDRRSWPSGAIAEIEMIRRRIIEVNRAFHKAKAEHARVEIEIRLWLGRDGGNMMDAAQFHAINLTMYLWRRRATRQWWRQHEDFFAAHLGEKLAVIERLDRKRLQIEVICDSPLALKTFGGGVRKLPRGWLKQILRKQKTEPLKIGNRTLIIPAGTAFGTGEHATTAMSLQMLERVSRKLKRGWSMVDLGTGSGILALAARCLGAERATGIDIDPMAISTAKANARRNKIDKVQFRVDDLRRGKFPRKIDIVTANLFSELLIEILPRLRGARRLILSGVLRSQERDLRGALRRHKIAIAKVQRRGKWIAIEASVG